MQGEGSALVALLNIPVDHSKTRRILEIRFPTLLYLLIDEQGNYRLIGRPGVPGGHFQVGCLDGNRRAWAPAMQQDGLLWESSKLERGCILHRVHRQHGADWDTAFIQHTPTYRKMHKLHVLERVDLVEATSLWNPQLAYQTIPCTLTLPCNCQLYQSLLETRDAQWGEFQSKDT